MKILEDIYEWEFIESSHLVDLERINVEVNAIPLGFALAYMENLKIKAPIVYGRLKEYAKKEDCIKWYNWEVE